VIRESLPVREARRPILMRSEHQLRDEDLRRYRPLVPKDQALVRPPSSPLVGRPAW